MAATRAVTASEPEKTGLSPPRNHAAYPSRPAVASKSSANHRGGRNSPPRTIKGTKDVQGMSEGKRRIRAASRAATRMRTRAKTPGKPRTTTFRRPDRRPTWERRRRTKRCPLVVTVRTVLLATLLATQKPVDSALGRGNRRQLTELLVTLDHGQAPRMPLVTTERCRQESLDHGPGLVRGVHPRTNGQDLGVVVRARQLGKLNVVRQGSSDAPDLVRGHLLAVAGSAQHDAERSQVAGHGLRRA